MSNTSQERERTNSRITYKATVEGIERATEALKKRGAGSKTTFAELCGLSRSTITNFFGRKPIELDNFQTICNELGLSDWKEIADFKSFDTNGKVELEQNSCHQTIDDEKVILKINVSVDKKDKVKLLNSLIQLARKLGDDDSIEIIDIEEGSIKLTLKGSPAGLERLERLFQSGELTKIFERKLNITVENVSFIDAQTSDNYQKNQNQKLLAFTIAGNVSQADIDSLKAALIDTLDTNQRKTSQNTEENAVLPKSIAAEALIYSKLVDLLGDDAKEVVKTIRQHAIISATCGVGVFVPDADLLAFVANTWTMYARINSVLGISLSKNALKSIATAVGTNVISVIPGMALASVRGFILKAIPGLGTIGGMAVANSTYYALSNVMGWIYLKGITTIVSSNETINDENIKAATKKASQDRDFVKSIFNKAKSNYSSDYNEEKNNTRVL